MIATGRATNWVQNIMRARTFRVRAAFDSRGFMLRRHVADDPVLAVVKSMRVDFVDPIAVAAELLLKQRVMDMRERLGCTAEEQGKFIAQLGKLVGHR